jgi:hypothetical protein
MNFIKEIFQGKSGNFAHSQFIRFGKGEYGRRALLSLWKTKSIKIKGSFEYANDFVLFVAELGEVSFGGNILSKEEIPEIKAIGQKKVGKWIYEVENISSSEIKKIAQKTYYFLLNGEGNGIKLKIKGKLPKPGKDEEKVDDKFCQMELDEKYYKTAKENFAWDLPDGKKTEIEHKFIINEIIIPKNGEKDFAKIREIAKRKGKIIRMANVDGKEIKKETDFEA